MIAPVKGLRGRDLLDLVDFSPVERRPVLDLHHAVKAYSQTTPMAVLFGDEA
jgi:hypothetical protein